MLTHVVIFRTRNKDKAPMILEGLETLRQIDGVKFMHIGAPVPSARPVVDDLRILECLLVAGSSSNIRSLSRKIEANLYEALLCAIYLDGGMPAARRFVIKTLKTSMDNAARNLRQNYKSLVQEYCQQRRWNVDYKQLEKSGPDNTPRFTYALYINGKRVSEGSGSSIKNAQQEAARKIVKQWGID